MNDGTEHVLIVDDEPRNVRLMEGIFQSAGYRVSKAYRGEEALHCVAGDPPDLICLDVMMPQMTGHDVCTQLRADPATRSIPVILVTALSSVEDKVLGLDMGADDFISKPVNRVEILAKARSLLRVKAVLDELAAAKRELERKNEALERLENLKESLTQMIVHDLRNPLTVIRCNLELTVERMGSQVEKDRERIERALVSAQGMMQMILDLLDIGRMEDSRLPLHLEEADLGRMVEAAASELEPLGREGGVEIVSAVEPDLPKTRVDGALVGRILNNLTSNALKHTPRGGRISIEACRAEGSLVLAVRDTGEGIPVEFQKLIFDKFGQVQLRKHGIPTGRGLGLAFCRLAAEAHGGRIWVESAPGEGSVFRVSLPLSGAPVPEPEREAVLTGASGAAGR